MNESALTDLERRLERLERSPNGGALSPQEDARIQREFDRLEGRMQDLEDRTASAGGLPVWWAVLALVGGLALGAFLPAALAGFRGGGSAADGKKGGEAAMTLQTPADLRAPLEYRLTDSAVVLRYRTKTGSQGVAVYPYALSGEPSVTYALPAEESAPKYGKTESERDPERAGDSSPRRPSRRASD